jgi:hypothetical protein
LNLVVVVMIDRQAVHQKLLHGIVTVDEPWRHCVLAPSRMLFTA